MKKIIIAILSTMLMTQSIVPVVAEGTLITGDEMSGIEELETEFSVEENWESENTDNGIYSLETNEDLTENEVEIFEETKNSDFSEEKELVSSREYMSSRFVPPFLQTVEYGKRVPLDPVLHKVPFQVTDYYTLKQFLEQGGAYSIELGGNIDLLEKVVIPPGAHKELNLNGYTINAGTTGQIEVQGDYFKLMNGTVIGALGDNKPEVPSEDTKAYKGTGFVYSPMKINKKSPDLENDIVIENITHRSTTLGDGGRGGFMVVNASNVFFKGNNTLTNGNYNIKGGSITFMDGKFVGTVTRQTSKTSIHHFNSFGPDLTINIGFHGYGTSIEREKSDQYIGDKRITVLENAEVELYNLNKIGDKWYTNNIGNFAVITVEGSLKMQSTYPPLRSIISETNSKSSSDYYGKSKAHTFNGMANINILEGATFIAESTETDGTHGAIFTYNTILNAYRPAELDIDDMTRNSKDKYPFFHSGYKSGLNSELNLYDMDVAVWPVNQTYTDSNVTIWEDVVALEHVDFSSFLIGNKAGKNKRVEPNINGLGNFNIRNYGRIRSEGDFPQVIPDKKYFEKNIYTIGNGDGVVTGPGIMDENGLFYGTSRFRKLDEFGRVVPVVNGEVILRNDLNPNEVYRTQTNQKGEWVMDLSKEKRTVGWYTLTIDDGDRREGALSRRVKVYMKDNTPPTGKTKLLKIEEGTTESLLNAFYSIDWAKDETSPDDKLTYEYLNLSDQERLRIIATPGLHNLRVGIYDEAGNELRLDAQVLVYKKGTDPDLLGYIEGHDFEVDKNIFLDANLSEKRALTIQYGGAKGYELTNQGYIDVTNDETKFIMEYGTVSSDGKKLPITLKLVINGKVEVIEIINAILVQNSLAIRIHQIENFYLDDNYFNGQKPNANLDDAKKTPKIYSNLENKTRTEVTTIYYPKPDGNSNDIIIDELLEDLDAQKRIQLDRIGYKQVKVKDKTSGGMNNRYVTYQTFSHGSYYGTQSMIVYSNLPYMEVKEVDIYIEYKTVTNFLNVPNLSYGSIEVISQQEETYALQTPTSGSGAIIGSNRATVVNTNLESNWSINLAVKDIVNQDNADKETFLGGLVYYKNGQEFDITDDPVTLESYNEPDKEKVELIKDFNFYSQNKNEGIRLKQRIGNSVGNYSGDLIWTLTSAPVP